jgi:hypothetical protein
MNFFNTRYYCNGYSHCQRVQDRKAKFFTIYPQNGTILRLDSAPKEPSTAVPVPASGQERDRPRRRKLSGRADWRNFGLPGPSHRLKPSPHVDYEGFHARSGNLLPEKDARRQPCQQELRANCRQRIRNIRQSTSPSQIRNRKSATRNSKWARLDSNQGPRDYESPALPLSYRPV